MYSNLESYDPFGNDFTAFGDLLFPVVYGLADFRYFPIPVNLLLAKSKDKANSLQY